MFLAGSDGNAARVEVFGNGNLDLRQHNAQPPMTIGSLEGDGIVFLNQHSLTIGGNNLSTNFSGVVQGNGSLVKTGTETLTLGGANLYLGGTTVTQGTLTVSNTTGSGTGIAPVSVNAGTLGGSGIIAGAVTVGTGSGTGAFLTPGIGTNKQVTLTIQNGLTFNSDATYTYTFKGSKSRVQTDLVIANGVTINGGTIVISSSSQNRIRRGTVLTVISNTSANPISGTFSNLPDGGIVTVNGNNLQANYEGGDGNDLTLTVVP
ncbi:MAG TPA: autotransporter-associated beta strand repeat-containing protein [Chthoniobacterales bacterium]